MYSKMLNLITFHSKLLNFNMKVQVTYQFVVKQYYIVCRLFSIVDQLIDTLHNLM